MLNKSKYTIVCLCFIVNLFSACDLKENSQIKTTKIVEKKVSEKVVKKIVKKETDTINKTNAVTFLKAYGKLNKESIILFKTRLGDIKIKLYKETPLHRASFVFLTKTGYFNTTSFHRIVPDFIVQGGNSDHPMTRKLRIRYNYRIPAEIKPYRKHKSSPFEFYMIQDKRGSHHLDGEHTIFGEIIEGFTTMEKIAKLETDKKEWPLEEVFISAEVIK